MWNSKGRNSTRNEAKYKKKLFLQLDEHVGEKIRIKPIVPKVNPLEKMLKTATAGDDDNEEMDDYDKIRMRNIQQRLELYKQVRCSMEAR